MAVLRQVCRNVKRWRDARMALQWTGTAMLEAEKGFRRLKAHKQLSILSAALLRHQQAWARRQLPAKIWQHNIQPMAPAAPISRGTGTILSGFLSWRSGILLTVLSTHEDNRTPIPTAPASLLFFGRNQLSVD